MRIAHRGAPQFAPENTLISFQKAVELKATHLEIDVQQTKDGKLIIMHDTSVDRTTNGKGDVAELNFVEISALDAGIYAGEKFKGTPIPTLEEVVQLVSSSPNLGLILELKKGNEVYPHIEEKVVTLIRKHNIQDRTILKSFSVPLLKRLRKQAPEMAQLYVFVTSLPQMGLTIDTFLRMHSPLDLPVEYVQSHGTLTSSGFIKAAHDKGKKVIVWGVEKQEDMKKWKELGVDGIETDRLDLLNF